MKHTRARAVPWEGGKGGVDRVTERITTSKRLKFDALAVNFHLRGNRAVSSLERFERPCTMQIGNDRISPASKTSPLVHEYVRTNSRPICLARKSTARLPLYKKDCGVENDEVSKKSMRVTMFPVTIVEIESRILFTERWCAMIVRNEKNTV